MRVFLCQWTGQDYPETSLPTSVPKIPNMMNLGLGAITAHGDMPDLALALRGTPEGVGKVERDHQVYLSISGGEFAGLSTNGDILLPRCLRHHRNSALTSPNRWPPSGWRPPSACWHASSAPFRRIREAVAVRRQPGH